ncbi:DUF2267 domain-containing protein [Streptomyces sp. NPDC058145]|uniref:DUF2267 domain-containing protein n=1 Tax=Streptomyces sp. NPDC058145 TaxID=3346356 RepID=UPI0036E8171A
MRCVPLPRKVKRADSDRRFRHRPARFVRRVSERAGADEAVARRGVAAVFMTLGEAVPDTEFLDVMSQLPNEFQNI